MQENKGVQKRPPDSLMYLPELPIHLPVEHLGDLGLSICSLGTTTPPHSLSHPNRIGQFVLTSTWDVLSACQSDRDRMEGKDVFLHFRGQDDQCGSQGP